MSTQGEWGGTVLAPGLQQRKSTQNKPLRQRKTGVLCMWCCLGEIRGFDIHDIILHGDSASPRALPGASSGLGLRARRGSLGCYFEYPRSDVLLKLPVFSGMPVLCFPCPWHVLKAAGAADVNDISWCRFLSRVTPLKSAERGICDGFRSAQKFLS